MTGTDLGRLLRRPAAIVAALFGLSAALGLAAVQVTSASFTDETAARLGTDGAIGGSYDIALLDQDDAIDQGDPTPLTLDTSSAGAIAVTTSPTASVQTRVVTTTAATGPVQLTLYNAYQGSRPTDPGGTGPGADPYDYALYTITVDGTVLATRVPAATVNATPLVLTGWTPSVPKTVEIDLSLPHAIGNPYVFNRSLVLGVRFDGATS